MHRSHFNAKPPEADSAAGVRFPLATEVEVGCHSPRAPLRLPLLFVPVKQDFIQKPSLRIKTSTCRTSRTSRMAEDDMYSGFNDYNPMLDTEV